MMTLHELDLMTLFAKWRQVTTLNILPYQHIKVILFDTQPALIYITLTFPTNLRQRPLKNWCRETVT